MASPIFRQFPGRLRTTYIVRRAAGNGAWKIADIEFFGVPPAAAVNATLTITEADDTLSSNATIIVKATLTITEADDTLVATATITAPAPAGITRELVDDLLDELCRGLVRPL